MQDIFLWSEKYAGYLSLQWKVCRISFFAVKSMQDITLCKQYLWKVRWIEMAEWVCASGGRRGNWHGRPPMHWLLCTVCSSQFTIENSSQITVGNWNGRPSMHCWLFCTVQNNSVQCTFYFRFCKVYLFQVGQRTAQRSFNLVQNAHIGVQFTAHCTLNTTSLNF